MHLQSERAKVLKDFKQPEFQEATRVFMSCRQSLLMTSDQDDFTPLVFPLVLAEASIGEGASRRSDRSSAFPPGLRRQGHVPEPDPSKSPIVRFSVFRCGSWTSGRDVGRSCRWSPSAARQGWASAGSDSCLSQTAERFL